MSYRTEKIIIDDNGQKFKVGDTVGVTFNNASGHEGGGFGGATIAKITDTGRLVEDDDQCEKWASNQTDWRTRMMQTFLAGH